jgi:hypothetical protein
MASFAINWSVVHIAPGPFASRSICICAICLLTWISLFEKSEFYFVPYYRIQVIFLLIGKWDYFPDQSFGMNPAESMDQHIKLDTLAILSFIAY